MPRGWKTLVGFVLCAAWLSFTVAFVGMVTGGGEANMELEIGPFLKLQDDGAVWFSRGMLGLGGLMAVLLWLRRRLGFILGAAWSVWWGALLTTTLLNTSGGERIATIIVVALFIASAWFTGTRWKKTRPVGGS